MVYKHLEVNSFSKLVIKGVKYKCNLAKKKLLDICLEKKENYECLEPKYVGEHNIDKVKIDGGEIYTVTPKNYKGKLHIVFYHGGGYALRGTKYHWKFISKLLKKIDCRVTYIDYPTINEKIGHVEIYNMALESYKLLNEKYKDDEFILMGDSAGGGLAMGVARRLSAFKNIKYPKKMFLFSPWLDISMANKEIDEKKDIILSLEGLEKMANTFAKGLNLKSRLVSPIYGDLEGLPEVISFVGEAEVMYPDVMLLDKLCEESGISIKTYTYKGMVHDFIIMPVKETDIVIEEISKNIF